MSPATPRLGETLGLWTTRTTTKGGSGKADKDARRLGLAPFPRTRTGKMDFLVPSF